MAIKFIRCTMVSLLILFGPATATEAVRSDLVGTVQGQVTFAQTHVTEAQRRIFDPFLVPGKPALVMFTPVTTMTAVDLVVTLDGQAHTFRMAPPEQLPAAAIYDQENTFSGKPIEGIYPRFRAGTFSYQLPWNLFVPQARLSFRDALAPEQLGVLPAERFLFMTPESDGLALMNIKGCIFKPRETCNVSVDQFDGETQPALARIAAREMLSEVPTQRLSLGTGKAYWATLVALGADEKPHVYDLSKGQEWAEFGDLTLPKKVGMGTYWRAASALGNKQPGQFVAITGQLLDVPEGMSVLPPGVGASCGGSSCNYPNRPVGYWHETGHGLGLPHSTPARYEDWAYRAYDNTLLPNTHPDPKRYGLGVDHLGKHYFGHVMGSLGTGSWPASTASAPLITEFETFKSWNADAASWLRYIAPYSHQQMLKVQRRFGTLPDVDHADIGDDHRFPPAPPDLHDPGAPDALSHTAIAEAFTDDMEPTSSQPWGTPVLVTTARGAMVASGVPVHTLVATFSDPSHNTDGINQIYPAIVSNYGNVFSAEPSPQPTAPNVPPAAMPRPRENASTVRFATTAMTCLAFQGGTVIQDSCESPAALFSVTELPPGDGEADPLTPMVLVKNAAEECLNHTLAFSECDPQVPSVRWRPRRDLTHNDNLYNLQESIHGRFITPGPENSVVVQAHSAQALLRKLGPDATPHTYDIVVAYENGSIEQRRLYTGFIVKDELMTGAVNVESGRAPRTAWLSIDGTAVDERQLEANDVPPAIELGAEKDEIGTLIPDTGPLRWIRSVNTGKCLVRRGDRARLGECTEEAFWRPFVKPGMSPDSPMITDQGGRCLRVDLSLGGCNGPESYTQWQLRTELTTSPSRTNLQAYPTGRFVTATAGSDELELAERSQGEDQLFDWTAPDFIQLSVSSPEGCITEARNTLRVGSCMQRAAYWRIARERPTEVSLPFALVGPSGRCVTHQLTLETCRQPLPGNQEWRPRKDLTWPEASIRLQQSNEWLRGLFVQANPDSSVTLAPFNAARQTFRIVSVPDVKVVSLYTGKCMVRERGHAFQGSCDLPEARWIPWPKDVAPENTPEQSWSDLLGELCLRAPGLDLAPCSEERALRWRPRQDMERGLRFQDHINGRFITVKPDDLLELESSSNLGDQDFNTRSDLAPGLQSKP